MCDDLAVVDPQDAGDVEAYARGLLVGQRTRLRPACEADLPVLDRWWQHVDVMALQRDVVLPQPEGAAVELFRRWSVNDLARPDVGFSVVDRHDDRLVGHVTLFGGSWRTRSAELAVMLGPDHRGRGLGTDAVRVLLGYAFAELGLHRVSLKVWAYNDRALAAYRRVGFVEEGRLREVAWHGGGWHDEVLMAVLDHEWRAARP